MTYPPENWQGTLEEEIPIRNHHFQVNHVSFPGGKWDLNVETLKKPQNDETLHPASPGDGGQTALRQAWWSDSFLGRYRLGWKSYEIITCVNSVDK